MKQSAKIVIVGDLFPMPMQEESFLTGKIEEIFDDRIIDLFHQADFSVCNLEGCLTNANTKAEKANFWIKASPRTINAYSKLGIDAVSLANNHITDFGNQGYLDTIEILEKENISFFGAGKDRNNIKTHLSCNVNGFDIVFYGVSERMFNIPTDNKAGANLYEEYRVCKEIEELKKECDYLIVLYHGGIENFHFTTDTVRSRFRNMADSGADIIISQHTHAIGSEEYYNNSYFLYGQGNFCFHFTKKIHEWNERGLLSEFEFSSEGIKTTHHIVRRTGARVEYDSEQDMSDFYERSKRNVAGDKYIKEFQLYSDEKFMQYLHHFRGENIMGKVLRRILSSKQYDKYLLNCYSKKQLIWMLQIIRSEEFREITLMGIEDAIKRKP